VEQQHIVRIEHRNVGRPPVLTPDGAEVEPFEGAAPRFHVGEAAQPDESIGTGKVAELAEDPHAVLLLPLDEMLLEQGDQLAAAARLERILAQLEDGTARLRGMCVRVAHLGFSRRLGKLVGHPSAPFWIGEAALASPQSYRVGNCAPVYSITRFVFHRSPIE
jgi:hypothetical protein